MIIPTAKYERIRHALCFCLANQISLYENNLKELNITQQSALEDDIEEWENLIMLLDKAFAKDENNR